MINKRIIDITIKQLIKHYGYEEYADEITKMAHLDIQVYRDLILYSKHTELEKLINIYKFLQDKKNKDFIICSNRNKVKIDEYITQTISNLLKSHIFENAEIFREEIQQCLETENIDMDEIFIFCNKRNWNFELTDEVFLKSIQKSFFDKGMLKVNNKFRTGLNKEYAFIHDMCEILKGEYNIDWKTPDKEKADKVKHLIEKDIHYKRHIFLYIDFFGENTR